MDEAKFEDLPEPALFGRRKGNHKDQLKTDETLLAEDERRRNYVLTARDMTFLDNYAKNGFTNVRGAMAETDPTLERPDNVGYKILKTDAAAQYIKKFREIIQRDSGITIARVLRELGRIAFVDPAEIFDEVEDEDGNIIPVLKPITQMGENARRAIQGFDVEETKIKGVVYGQISKPRFYNKNDALEKLGKYLGMFVEKMKIDQTVNYRELKDASDEELEELAKIAEHQVLNTNRAN